MADSTTPPRQWVFVMPRHDDDGELARRLEVEANTKLEAFFGTVEGKVAMVLTSLHHFDIAEALFRAWNEREMAEQERQNDEYDARCRADEADHLE